MSRFSLTDIRKAVSGRSFERGFQYQRQGRVRLGRIAEDGTEIEADVQGSERWPYHVVVSIDGAEIEGSCSCPVGYNCKHVAAALLEVLNTSPGKVAAAKPGEPKVPAELADWIGSLDTSLNTATDEYPPDIDHRLLYILLPEIRGATARLVVGLRSVRLLKDGSISTKVSRYSADNIFASNPAKYLRPVDHALLRAMARGRSAYGSSFGSSDIPLSGEDGVEMLTKILATGRCRWQAPDGPTLVQGPPRQATAGWRLMPDGRQQFGCDAGPGAVTLALSPPWYGDPNQGCCGPLDIGLPGRVAATLLAAPPVPPTAIPAVRTALSARLAERLAERPALLPQELAAPEEISPPPRPHLTLVHRRLQNRWSAAGYRSWNEPEHDDLMLGRLAFDYGDHRVNADETSPSPTFVRDGRIFVLKRDRAAEQAAAVRLQQYGFVPARTLTRYEFPRDLAQHLVLSDPDDPQAELRFLHRGVPALCAQGWTVVIDSQFPYRLGEVDDDWAAELSEGSGVDWFELSLGVTVDGQKVDLVPLLVGLLQAGLDEDFLAALDETDDGDDDLFVPVADGTVIALPAARLRPILAALLELFAAGGIDDQGNIRFSLAHAAELAALEDATASAARLRWLGADRLRALGRKLRDFTGIATVPPPPSFRGSLRDYQQQGLNWLQFLSDCGLGGVLADDMGLGKTVQTLAHLSVEKTQGRMDQPALVVAPTSLMANWRREAEKFAPDLRVLTLHGPDRKDRFDAIDGHDLVLTTYPLLPRDREVLVGREWHAVILDEAHTIKNPQTAIFKVAQLLRARHRLCLTGTPVENHLGELWALFHFLSPGLLGDGKQFAKTFRQPIEKQGNARQQELLNRRVRPFLLRRTKAQVAAELPPKTELVEPIELEAAQRDVYESVRLAMDKKVRDAIAAKGLARSHIIFLDALLKLRQACCDPRLLNLKGAAAARARSAKLERLMEMLPELLDEGRRILLFSQFTSMLRLIEAALVDAGIAYVMLTGQTKDRATPVERFQTGAVPLFLISLKAGGTGLNLTAADTVIHYDPWWNPAVEAQATDRAHRIGQDKPVFVHKLIALDSIEEKMLELQTRKRALAESLFDPDAKSAAQITEEDIAFLLSAA